jgi:hypothetical protein
MTRVTLLAISLMTVLSACGTASESAASNSITLEPRSAAVSETEAAAVSDAYSAPAVVATNMSANTATAKSASLRQDGTRPVAVSTKISLNKAEETYTSDRKVIRNAELNLEADDPEDAQRKITSIAELRGGFVVESQQSSSEIRSTIRDIVTMTVRVPSDKFGDALADIRNVSTRVVVETVKGQDVTEEFIDIEAQLKAKKALEQQFMEIMKRANTVGDALHVQSQLADVRGEIERIEGRRRFLENQSSMSTIKVRLQTAKVIAASSVGIGGRLADSFNAGADVAISFVLGLVTVVIAALPFAIFVGLPAFVLFRYVLKRQSRPRSVVELAEDELKRA